MVWQLKQDTGQSHLHAYTENGEKAGSEAGQSDLKAHTQ